jgi:hypothetical protein
MKYTSYDQYKFFINLMVFEIIKTKDILFCVNPVNNYWFDFDHMSCWGYLSLYPTCLCYFMTQQMC